MDESDRFYSISIKNNKTPSLQTINGHSHGNITEEFARYFSIDNDNDDDIIILDTSEIIFDQVKFVLNDLLQKIEDQEYHSSQIVSIQTKRSCYFNDTKEYFHNKKVRFYIPDENQEENKQLSKYLFVSETLPSTTISKPSIQFLSNLGFDLCLEQICNETNSLSEYDKQTLIKHNANFHQYSKYSCKYCSFQTNTIHVMDYHYRTPHIYHHNQYRCTYCSFQTYRLSQLRRHLSRKHKLTLISEPTHRRYQCVFCSYETDEKTHFSKHNKRCQIEQTRTCMGNNLLAPSDLPTITSSTTMKSKIIAKNNTNQRVTMPTTIKSQINQEEILEPILIESDHDTSSLSRSSSDEDFIVSSDEENTSNSDNESSNNHDSTRLKSSKPTSSSTFKSTTSFPSSTIPIVSSANTLPSLSKLLLLNTSSTPSFIASNYNINKSSLVSIQPKPTSGTDIYQICNICQCYIFKNDYAKHMNEKHQNISSHTNISTPILILNTTVNQSNTSNNSIKLNSLSPKDLSQSSTTIFLLSTSNTQLTSLNMIKCPWCDTNFEHIDIMTGHLMRYHRMTLAAAKVVVAEQMKIQARSSTQLTHLFKEELEKIQKEFSDQIYWKVTQPKIYLHQLENLSCFVCNVNVDNIENHFRSSHQIELTTMNTIKQCCLCGFHCDSQNSSLFEHQLRVHTGVCYSSVLKQFIRFQPPPPPPSSSSLSKNLPRLLAPIQKGTLTTHTDKKFGCRKCDQASSLFIFEDLIEHLRIKHQINVKLYRRCIICQETYLKGKEYNQHCLEHLKDRNPSVQIQRQYRI